MTGTGAGGLCGTLLRWALLSGAPREVIYLDILRANMQISISPGAQRNLRAKVKTTTVAQNRYVPLHRSHHMGSQTNGGMDVSGRTYSNPQTTTKKFKYLITSCLPKISTNYLLSSPWHLLCQNYLSPEC